MNKRLFAVIYMFIITLFFTSLVTGIKVLNQGRIQTNRQAKLQRVVLQVLQIPFAPDASGEEIVDLFTSQISQEEIEGRIVYTAYESSGKNPRAYAVSLNGTGVWGPIHTMVGVDAEVSRVIGVEFYQHQETPGLGARITEPWFEKQFVGLSVAPRSSGRKYFSFASAAQTKPAVELDAITGATQTSNAVMIFLNRELLFLTDLRKRILQGKTDANENER